MMPGKRWENKERESERSKETEDWREQSVIRLMNTNAFLRTNSKLSQS